MDLELTTKRLKEYMATKGITNAQLSKETKLSPSAISRYINGERRLSEKSLIKLAYVLNINPSYLTGDSNNPVADESLTEMYNLVREEEQEETNIPSFSSRLRRLLSETEGCTATKLSKEINVSKATISRYKNGVNEPSFESLIKIADYFNVSLDYLLGRTYIKKL